MEENLEKNEKQFKTVENKTLKKKGKFIIIYIFFVVILAGLTAGAIYFTLQQKESRHHEENQNVVIGNYEEQKKDSDDSIYVINSYWETYSENPIEIINYYDDNGTLYKNEYHNNKVHYIQIEGLKNKEVQDNINQKLKDLAYSLKNDKGHVNEEVIGNFANILSVEIEYTYSSNDGKNHEEKYKSLNVDLSTGEEIPFEKVFTDNASIKAILTDAFYDELSWFEFDNGKNPDIMFSVNMDKIDTSEYEDKFILLARKYEKQKGSIAYTVSPTQVKVYSLFDKTLMDREYMQFIRIDLFEHRNEVAIYKRYLNDNDIFEKTSEKNQNITVFTSPYSGSRKYLYHGKLKNNIFLTEAMECYEEKYEKIAKHVIDEKSKELKNSMEKQVKENEAILCQRVYEVSKHYKEEYIVINIKTYKAKCSLDYFKEDAMKDFIKMKSIESGESIAVGFSIYQKEEFPNLNILDTEFKEYYLDMNGKVVANSREEFEEFIKPKPVEPQIPNEQTELMSNSAAEAVETIENIVENTATNNTEQNIATE